ncbi:ATP-dependent RecD-like DNA helicase, partial [Vibrio parahaemolyticus]|uniref:helix-hairpin-helix domain-containing protein n=1 Tax=Vibrio parahaemolyticus TaxID=670 RepID=UPI001D13D2D8
PYRMMEEVTGVGFKTCDKMALAMGFEKESLYRLSALMNHNFKELCFNPGHSFIDRDILFKSMPPFEKALLEEAYHRLIKERILILDDEKLYHHTQYDAETYVAKYLNNKLKSDHTLYLDDFGASMAKIERKLSIEFDDVQQEAIQTFLENDVVILT